MWFLIRAGFWFSLVLMFLPIFAKPDGAPRSADEPKVQVSDALSAASGVMQYVGAMCAEKPDVCQKGGETLTALGYQARDGARVAYDLLGQHFKDDKSGEQAAANQAVTAPVVNRELVAAEAQPMPAKRPINVETADAVVTGTVKLPSYIPVPLPKPRT
ncbi:MULTISPECIES: DUF5330 domain-containing protein [unclassified Rhizobium]|uniref:DUF5330 domain-containing protein n=1 Tax=unclassified Rhizobium TaxID=2613769 RepID=UPI000CDF46A1|nr:MULTISPECIES: DUF5330 domain-containing protein [Rhizobium]AVA20820.1 hypothetical protein NXC24_CH01154 [Rhizobium sp. NXC24]MDK4738965.1 DUF5330 domain-containing protein [Rhizobium sp. CNPSo 3464]UWU22033.1 DUF5330 domain-containing protein [Rhizobium tropici]